MEEVKNEEKSPKKKRIMLFIIFFLFFLVFAFEFCHEIGIIYSGKTTEEKTDVIEKDQETKDIDDQTKEKPESVPINDQVKEEHPLTTEEDIINKTVALWRYFNYQNKFSESKDDSYQFMMKNKTIWSSDLDEMERKSIVIQEIKREHAELDVDDIRAINEKITKVGLGALREDLNSARFIAFVSKENFDDMYRNYFHEEVNYNVEDSSLLNIQSKVLYCSQYVYIPSLNMYYAHDGCGYGIGAFSSLYHVNRVTINDNEAFAFLGAGHFEFLDANSETVNVFDDVIDGKVCKILSSVSEAAVFKIDESNYQDFSEYKFTYKKDNNGNYYFESIEKIK